MLSLLDIASRACALMGLDDTPTREQAKEFARTRWRMLWDAALWPQSRTLATDLVLAAGTDTLELPATMALPTMVRYASNGLAIPSDSELAATLAETGAFLTMSGDNQCWQLIEPAASGAVRIRFAYAATRPTPLLILGKRACPDLATDDAAPTIPGSDLCLLAHTEADLYEWQRQLGKAQAKRAEAMALQTQMLDLAIAQTGHTARLVPWAD